MATDQQLKNKWRYLKSQLTGINKVIAEDDTTSVSDRWSRIENLFVAYKQLEEENFTEDTVPDDALESLNYDTCSKVKALLQANATQSSVTHSTSNVRVSLPAIKVPEFAGNPGNWSEFPHTFLSLIHENQDLNDTQKLHYLKSSLKGEAAQAIRALPITPANYAVARQILEERFEDKRITVNSHIKALRDIPYVTRKSYHAIRSMLYTLIQTVESLRTLNRPIEQCDDFVIFEIVTKLDNNSRREWEIVQQHNVMPNFAQLKEFLVARCRALRATANKEPRTQRPEITQSRTLVTDAKTTGSCTLCNASHFLSKCETFLLMSVQERNDFVKRSQLCFNCFGRAHAVKNCKRGNCRICKRRHNTLLHPENATPNYTGTDGTPSSDVLNAVPLESSAMVNCMFSRAMLSTCMVRLHDANGKMHLARAILDSGSQINLINQRLVQQLNLSPQPTYLQLTGVTQGISVLSQKISIAISSTYNNFSTRLDCYVTETITGKGPSHDLNMMLNDIPANLELADPQFHKSRDVDILIGAATFYKALCAGQITTKRQIRMQKTVFGWIVSGNIPALNMDNANCNVIRLHQINDSIKSFFEIEACQSRDMSRHDCIINEHFSETYTRDKTGRFIVKLPWKEPPGVLGDSRNMALNRFYALERKLSRKSELRRAYVDFINEYINLGHMQIASSTVKDGYYLAHHAVIKSSSSSTRVRVVFDASAKTSSGKSLNDILEVGPTLQYDLFSLLIKFRMHKVVLTADIQKMYRQVLINASEQRSHKVFWRENSFEKIKEYQLRTVTYGTAPASYLATKCLQQIALIMRDTYPIGSEKTINDFYVDDLITGGDSVDEVLKIHSEVTALLLSAGFELHKWSSNNYTVLEKLTQNLNSESILTWDKSAENKILEIQWNPRDAYFRYTSNNSCTSKITKRFILAQIAKIFNPLGLIAPIIVTAKLMLQKLWLLQISWDTDVPRDVNDSWISFAKNLHAIGELEIPRHVCKSERKRVELHGFSDASMIAYGACIYLKTIDANNSMTSRLLCAKSRVAPVKTISLPRLELCAAVLLSQLMQRVCKTLNIKEDSTRYYTDLTIVLAWIKSPAAKWKTFVANRAGEIQYNTCIENWSHVETKMNPADVLSRGCSVKHLNGNNLWWLGPQFLVKAPQFKDTPYTDNNVVLTEAKTCIAHVQEVDETLFERVSSYNRLIRVTAYCLRFLNNCQKRNKTYGSLKGEELSSATTAAIKLVQAVGFPGEIVQLKKGKNVTNNSKLLSLNPFLDECGVIRVGGRLSQSNLAFDKKFPIVLPTSHKFTKLLIEYEHKRHFHAGMQATLAAVRSQYWPLSARNVIRQVLRKCVGCFKIKPHGGQPIMGSLPAYRSEQVRPFTRSGLDYAGPFMIKEGGRRSKKRVKVYVAVFVCMAVKAVHFEVVNDLTSEALMSALRRFIARRGMITDIFSDNATNFVGANNELKELYDAFQKQGIYNRVIEDVAQLRINWHFIPPRTPHMGELWEATVKRLKHHLRRIIGNASLTFEEFNTYIVQIEAILNSRPLTPISEDPNDLSYLTPAHFLIGDSATSIIEPSLKQLKLSNLSRWQHIQLLKQHFWDRWSREYLMELHQRHKWKSSSGCELIRGQLVLIKEDNLAPLKWSVGRISAVHPGKDNVVRTVSIKTSASEIKRGVTKVCAFPIDDDL